MRIRKNDRKSKTPDSKSKEPEETPKPEGINPTLSAENLMLLSGYKRGPEWSPKSVSEEIPWIVMKDKIPSGVRILKIFGKMLFDAAENRVILRRFCNW